MGHVLPSFQQLEELDITIFSSERIKLQGLHRSSFPRLKKIRLIIKWRKLTTDVVRKYFRSVDKNPWDTVDVLEFYGHGCTENGMKCLARVFPRVSHIRLDCSEGEPNDAWLVEAFPSLTKLDIMGLPSKHGSVDTFLTGISLNIVSILCSIPKQVLSPELMKGLRQTCRPLTLPISAKF